MENVIQIKSGITINVNVSVKIQIFNPATCRCKNCKYLTSIIDDSVITCDEIMEELFKNYSNSNCSNKKYFNKLLYFTRLFINYHSIIVAVSIYC